MVEIIKFPYVHTNNINLESIHEMIDEFPTDDPITGFMIIVTTENKNILTCYDNKESVKSLGALEILKHNILQNMD